MKRRNREKDDPGQFREHHHIPFFCIILMVIGMMTLLYLLIVWVIIPFLAMMTVS